MKSCFWGDEEKRAQKLSPAQRGLRGQLALPALPTTSESPPPRKSPTTTSPSEGELVGAKRLPQSFGTYRMPMLLRQFRLVREGCYCTAMVTALEVAPPMLSRTATALPVGALAGTSAFT